MLRNWSKFREQSPTDRRLLVRAAIALPMVAALVRCFGVRQCQAILTRITPLRDVPARDLVANLTAARGIAHRVCLAATRGFYSANCLERSLVLWWLLRRQGLKSEIHYGARTFNGRFAAHAWVEYASQVIGDRNDLVQQFAKFEPAAPANATVQGSQQCTKAACHCESERVIP